MPAIPLTIKDAAAALRSGQISSTELTAAMLERIERLNSELGAFIAISAETAMQAATKADADFSRGLDVWPASGNPDRRQGHHRHTRSSDYGE